MSLKETFLSELMIPK